MSKAKGRFFGKALEFLKTKKLPEGHLSQITMKEKEPKCPCGHNKKFTKCCEPFLKGKDFPNTAEKLMRSRYVAYTKADIDYLEKTWAPESRDDFDKDEAMAWAKESHWKALKILSRERGGPEDREGIVEFKATYEFQGKTFDHHEVSHFRRNKEGRWLFVEGEAHTH